MVIDDGIDPGHPQFQGRIDPYTDVTYIADEWDYARCFHNPACETRSEATLDDAEIDALDDVLENGAPTADDSVVYRVGTPESGYDYLEIAAVRENGPDGRSIRKHGTAVASVALGRDLGIAPEAELYFISIPFGSNDRLSEQSHLYTPEGAASYIYQHLSSASQERIEEYDDLAAWWYEWLTVESGVVVINRSYGHRIRSWPQFDDRETEGVDRYAWITTSLPKYTAAMRNPNAAVIVTAAGNTTIPYPDFEGSLAFYDQALRGRYLAVVGVDRDGTIYNEFPDGIESGSSRCGSLPSDWDAARDGRHYCLAAPIFATLASPKVANGIDTNYVDLGTSYSAPIVSGTIALMAEQFPNVPKKDLGRKLVDSADNTGIYADSLIYGAGLLDIGAATSPDGPSQTGLSSDARRLIVQTVLSTPTAWGDLGARAGDSVLTGFDDRNFPFFYPVSGFLSPDQPSDGRSLADHDFGAGQAVGPQWSGLAWFAPEEGGSGPLTGLSFAYASGGSAEAQLGAYGFSWAGGSRPWGGNLRAGVVFEDGSFLGGHGRGAFEGDARHGLAFGSWSHSFAPGWAKTRGVAFGVQTLWAGGRLTSGSGLLTESGGLYSQHRASVTLRPKGEDGPATRLTLSQPLRAEAGEAVIRRPVGRRLDGTWVQEDLKLPLEPDARALSLGLGHERSFGRKARLSVQWERSFDAGHVRGADRTWLGAKLRVEL